MPSDRIFHLERNRRGAAESPRYRRVAEVPPKRGLRIFYYRLGDEVSATRDIWRKTSTFRPLSCQIIAVLGDLVAPRWILVICGYFSRILAQLTGQKSNRALCRSIAIDY